MTTRKKIIRIIIFIICIGVLVFGVYWLVSRHQAAKTGSTPATFRQFLGFNTQTTPATPAGSGELSSGFTSPGQSTTASGTGSASSTTGTAASQFTNDTLSPTDTSGSSNTTSGSGTGISDSGSGTSAGTMSGPTGAPVSVAGSDATNACTDADVNITFTPDELARLQALQERFYTIAQTLHTDADVATELANYSDFKLKLDNLNDLLAYCSAAAPKLTNPAYQTKVPTPFWYNLADIRTNGNPIIIDPTTGDPVPPLPPNVPLGYLGQPGPIGGLTEKTITPEATANGLRSIEQVLRLNLW